MSTASNISPPGASASESSAGRVVVGVDGSGGSIAALQWAARFASKFDVEIDAVTSWYYPTSYGFPGGAIEWRPDEDAEKIVAAALISAFGDEIPNGLRFFVREGHPARVLVEASQGAQLLVVGSRGHGGFVGLLLGSVSTHCAEHSDCPVVIHRAVSEVPPATPS